MSENEILSLLGAIVDLLNGHNYATDAARIALLRQDLNEAYQSGRTRRVREALRAIDQLYGGMGSFSDLTIGVYRTGVYLADESASASEQLDYLLAQLAGALDIETKRVDAILAQENALRAGNWEVPRPRRDL